MAEAAALIGLVASIASLVDLSVKVVSRLHGFISESSDIPESFRFLWLRLPLLTATLQQIQCRAEAGRFPDDVTKSLKVLIDSTSDQVSTVQTCLSKVLPSNDASRLERALKALKSLAKEHKIQEALEKIYKNNDLLVLHQTTQHVNTGDRILEELSKLSVASPASSKSLGVCLGQAPQIAADAFIGRTKELQQLQDWLSPKSQPNRQRIISIVGIGGVGKTQLSLAHVRDCADKYSSVFWVNAKDETSLRQSMVDLSAMIFHESAGPAAQSADSNSEKLKINKVRHWLSEPENDQWLFIFDNYDDPCLPGINSSTGYDARSYFPHRAQGSILITTRSPQLLFAKQLPLKKLDNIEQSLAILATRSGRKVDEGLIKWWSEDSSAKRLAQRLDGLPLALTTAGTYLSQSGDSFDVYLKSYNNEWSDLSQYSRGPIDYEERTLYSTWNVSFQQVQDQDPAAAELLKLMAYLDNQDLWYDLFHEEVSDPPAWWTELLKSRARFNRAISILHNHSLLEVSAGQYSLHTCEHDWTLEHLNQEFDQEMCRIAIQCVAANVGWRPETEYWVKTRRVLPHARRFEHVRIKAAIDWSSIEPKCLASFGELYNQNDLSAEAEEMYLQALHGCGKTLGYEHPWTLSIYNNLGAVYAKWDKWVEAEKIYQQGLQGNERIQGLNHPSTLCTVHNLAMLYSDLGKLEEAEKMYLRASQGQEKALGVEHPSTLNTFNNLGNLYIQQDKLKEAEEMYLRVLQGREKALGFEHTLTLDTVNNLGILYSRQGKLEEAEEMYLRALQGKEKIWGFEHTSTLITVANLGAFYYNYQDKFDEAEKMHLRALYGYEKAWGSGHTSTLIAVYNLGALYSKQGKFKEAEKIYIRALQGNEKALGLEHASTLIVLNNLGGLYSIQGKLKEAEELFLRALQAEKVWGFEHDKVLIIVNNLGLVYHHQGKLGEEEKMYVQALQGFEEAVGKDHPSTQKVSGDLKRLQACKG